MQFEKAGDRISIICDICGEYKVSTMAARSMENADGNMRPLIIYSVCQLSHSSAEPPIIRTDWLTTVLKETKLPSVAEQADRIILALGDTDHDPAKGVVVNKGLSALIGSRSVESLCTVMTDLKVAGLLDGDVDRRLPTHWARLTLKGWAEYQELKRGSSTSRKVFMASKWGDSDLDNAIATCFRPAVARTGFELVQLSDPPRAGLIDDRMRVEIRMARFMLADLTHGNAGAYWEAGYAEGLGKPVIYLCEESRFNSQSTHFDTNHHLTVKWNPANLQQAADDLVATIRATLPLEAKLQDE
jgi:hypothetical protein